MNLPAEALKDLRQSMGAVLRYMIAVMLAVFSCRLLLFAAQHRFPEETYPQLFAMTRLLAFLYLAFAASAVQAVCLAMLGAEIDRPLWKYKGMSDALQRFFVPWLIINLFLITLVDIQSRLLAADMTDVAVLLEFVILMTHAAAMPVAACIMHWGALEWGELGEALRPLGRLFSLALLPFAVGIIQYLMSSARALGASDNMLIDLVYFSVTDVPLLLLEVFIFAMVWRICMHHRSLPPVDDNPLDF